MRPARAMQIALEDTNKDERTYTTPYRGEVLICAPKTGTVKGTIGGACVCIADLSDVVEIAPKEYEWIFDDVKLVRPVEVKGKQRLFDVDLEPSDLNVCTATEVDDAAAWLEENFLPFVKGAKKIEDGEWEVSWPFEL